MEFIASVVVIAQTIAIYLGVGSSTLAITSFFVAIHDGAIDQAERKMLGVIYWVLRVAMVLILVTTAVIHVWYPNLTTSTLLDYMWVMIAVLFLNALLMTIHLMPSKFGPSIQAATWYTLGFLVTIEMFDLYELTLSLFIGLYLADLLVMLVSVNAYMWYFKTTQKKRQV